jgi:protein TonB
MKFGRKCQLGFICFRMGECSVVGPDGRPTDIEVVQGPGLGLDEQAIAAVKTWRFRPALGPNRLSVPTQIIIEVQFRLL